VDYREAIDFLFPLHRFGIKPGLDRVIALLESIGSPQDRLGLVIHVAGTNGKGTVAACLASIFQASGRKTGLYTSPHLVDFTERIRINGRKISGKMVAEYCDRFRETIVDQQATFFEATTAIAFAYFADEQVDVSVIETGMGGRLDATNVVKADYVIIPSISTDHTAWLGESLRDIAREKAAIIKRGSKVYTGVTDKTALEVIRDAASACESPLYRVGTDAWYTLDSCEPGRLVLDVTIPPDRFSSLKVPLTGSFHASNVTLAVMAAHAAGIQREDMATGLAGLAATGYRARLEMISSNPVVLLDVSHNPDGMEKSVQAVEEMKGAFRAVHVLFGLASDKDAVGIVSILARLTGNLTVVNLPVERGLPSEILGDICLSAGAAGVTVCESVAEGLEKVCGSAGPEDLVLITGSFYLAGEVITLGGCKKRTGEVPHS
jgi:dihydrofolate synthase/folylpolyglutamate synthase